MKARLYLRIFLSTAIPFGFMMGAFFAAIGAVLEAFYGFSMNSLPGALAGVLLGLVAGGVFGLAMSAILGTLHFAHTDTPFVRHQRTFSMKGTLEESKRLCVEAIRAIPGAEVDKNQRGDDRLVVRTRTSWKSFGEVITFSFRPGENEDQIISFESCPVVKTTLVDYGRNLENVEAISTRLRELDATEVESD